MEQGNFSRSSVSESFFDKFTEYPWNKYNPAAGTSSHFKTQFKKKNKTAPPLFVGNTQITSVGWEGGSLNFASSNVFTTNRIEVANHASLTPPKLEPINPFHSPTVQAFNFRPPQHNNLDQYAKEKVKNVFRRNTDPHDFGRWRKSLSESEATDLTGALSELKLLETHHSSSPLSNSFKDSAGCAAATSQTDTSQDEFDSDSPSLFSSSNSTNVTALESYILRKLKKDRIKNLKIDDREIDRTLGVKNWTVSKKRSKSQPVFHGKSRNGGGESLDLNPANCNKASGKKSRRKCKSEDKFEGLIGPEEALRGLKENIFIQGDLRINPKNYTEAYVSHPVDSQDVLIIGVADRNRALEADVVVVEIKEEDKWRKQQNGSIQKTGKVVHILELVHTRSLIGLVQNYDDKFVILRPRDCRLPRLLVSIPTLPEELKNNIDQYEDVYFKAQIICWNTPTFAQGLIVCMIGRKGEISGETEAILKELDLDSEPVPESLNKYLPSIPYKISQEEINSRLDLRKETVFSIDPETARDLDDALSIKKISSNKFEVGVHISDVSYFLTQGTPLDDKVSERATTIYMVDRVNHMLPVQLCMLCSLLPGEDKFAFSVIWEMDAQGNISSTKFSRTVINSCAQLSYGHAQDILDGKEAVGLPKIYNGKTEKDIRESILALYTISKNLTAKRFAGGALRIDQPKVSFRLDDDCLPCDAFLYQLRDSNRLIEEFMLLANQSVAEFIHKKYPKVALLRKHSPPKKEMITKLEISLNKLGIFIDRSSSGNLHNSLHKYTQDDPARAIVLNCLCSKAMTRAIYYCYEPDTHHYALNIDMYTHFTSPIRRYVDIVVHRVLAAALDYSPLPAWITSTVRQFAKNSNQKKYAAKRAGEASSDLFTSLYIRKLGTLEVDAVVFNINSNSLDTIVTSLALKIRVHIDDLEDVKVEYKENDIASSLHFKWKRLNFTQVVQMFSEVRLLLKTQESALQIEAQLLPPSTSPTYTSDPSSSYHSAVNNNQDKSQQIPWYIFYK